MFNTVSSDKRTHNIAVPNGGGVSAPVLASQPNWFPSLQNVSQNVDGVFQQHTNNGNPFRINQVNPVLSKTGNLAQSFSAAVPAFGPPATNVFPGGFTQPETTAFTFGKNLNHFMFTYECLHKPKFTFVMDEDEDEPARFYGVKRGAQGSCDSEHEVKRRKGEHGDV